VGGPFRSNTGAERKTWLLVMEMAI